MHERGDAREKPHSVEPQNWAVESGKAGFTVSWLLSSAASGECAIPDLSGLVRKLRTLAFYTTVVRIQ